MTLELKFKVEKLRKLAQVYERFESDNLRDAWKYEEARDEESASMHYAMAEDHMKEVATLKQIIKFLEDDQETTNFIDYMIDGE